MSGGVREKPERYHGDDEAAEVRADLPVRAHAVARACRIQREEKCGKERRDHPESHRGGTTACKEFGSVCVALPVRAGKRVAPTAALTRRATTTGRDFVATSVSEWKNTD